MREDRDGEALTPSAETIERAAKAMYAADCSAASYGRNAVPLPWDRLPSVDPVAHGRLLRHAEAALSALTPSDLVGMLKEAAPLLDEAEKREVVEAMGLRAHDPPGTCGHCEMGVSCARESGHLGAHSGVKPRPVKTLKEKG